MGALKNPGMEQSLYDRDLYEWSLHMADMLRKRNAAALDWEHLAEEIEGLAGRDRREMFSRIEVLITHLLKSQAKSGRPPLSWANTISEQRSELEILFDQNPSLRRFIREAMDKRYPRATKRAVQQMRMTQNPFPAECPFTPKQLLGDD